MAFIYFAQVKVGMHFMTVNILKIEWSYQVCAMQKVARIFSTKIQFGTLKQNISKKLILIKKRKIYGVDSLTDL